MSQGQPQKPHSNLKEPIKYGDIFSVTGELATKPVVPGDAATMQAAECVVLGHTQKGGPAAVMQSAATVNELAGLVGHFDTSDISRVGGVIVSEDIVGRERVVVEAIGGQVVSYYVEPFVPMETPGAALDIDSITIGEALEASALGAGDNPIEQSDAAAIQAAEMMASATNETMSCGVGAEAQSAATLNTRTVRDEDKTTLCDVLSDATAKLPGDRPVMREDAEKVMSAEIRNDPAMSTAPGGVGDSMAAAARINQERKLLD